MESATKTQNNVPQEVEKLGIREEMKFRAMLHQKIEATAYSLGVLKTDKYNTFLKHGYISEDGIMVALAPTLHDNGLSMLGEVQKFTPVKEGSKVETTVQMNFELVDMETGYRIVRKAYGVANDTNGTSYAQAVTSCVRNFCIKTFKIAAFPTSVNQQQPSTRNQLNTNSLPSRPINNSTSAQKTNTVKSLTATEAAKLVKTSADCKSMNVLIGTFDTSVKQSKTVMQAIKSRMSYFEDRAIKEIEASTTEKELDNISKNLCVDLKKSEKVINAGKTQRESLKAQGNASK